MKTKIQLRSLAAIVIGGLAIFAIAAAPGVAAKGKPLYWINLAGTAERAPDFVYFTANAGGYMEDVVWERWGKFRTVGRGTFGTSAPCNDSPCPEGPAKLVLRKPMRCTPEFGNKKNKKIRVYRRGKITYPDGSGGMTTTDISDRTGSGVCKESH